MTAPLHILMVDDNAVDRARIREQVEKGLGAVEISEAAEAADFARRLKAGGFDLVLVDYLMPWTTGIEVVQAVKARWPDVPVLMVTGSGNEEIAIQAIKAGLDDYILKSPRHLARLAASIHSALDRVAERKSRAEAESRYRDLFDQMPLPLYRAGRDGRFLDVNPALVELLGFPDRETLMAVAPAEIAVDLEDERRHMAAADRDGVVRGVQRQLRRFDGALIWVRSSARAVRDREGRVRFYEGCLEDVTEQERAEEALRARTRQLETMRAMSAEITRELDLPTVMNRIAARAAQLVGAAGAAVSLWDESEAAVVPRAWCGYGPWLAQVRCPLGEGLTGTVARSGEAEIANSCEGWEAGPPVPDAPRAAAMAAPLLYHGQTLGVITVSHSPGVGRFGDGDLAMLRLLADHAAIAVANARLFGEVSRAKREWEITFDAAADQIALLDPGCRILRVNQAAARALGRAPTAIIGQECRAIFPSCHEAGEACQHRRCLAAQQSLTEERETADGRILVETCSPFFFQEGRLLGVIQVSKDITGHRHLQQQLMHAEKMAAMGRLVSGVAHELNNPLTAVRGTGELLLLTHVEAPMRQGLQTIVDEADRAARIVRNLLAFARPHKPERQTLQVNGVLDEAIALRAYAFHVQNVGVTKRLAPDLPPVRMDADQIRQVLVNLLINAEQAVAERGGSGHVWVLSERDAESGCVRIRVEDDGVGIPPAILSQIFDPFFTTREVGRGTGLGLSICYAILGEHGGSIRAGNRAEGGAWFEIDLPAEAPVAGPAEPGGGAGGPCLPQRILVVDDEEAIVRVVAGALRAVGHQVDVATSGPAAAEQLSGGRYDLIFMDMRMPGLDGERMFDELVQPHPRPPRVVIMTGDTISQRTRAFLARTGLQCLEKPFTLEQLWAYAGAPDSRASV